MNNKNKYIYPRLPALKDFWFFRVGGSGLANCLFIYARAIIMANAFSAKIITPAWFNLSVGTYIRGQSDKRHYSNLFISEEVKGFKKILVFLFKRKFIKRERGLNNYFEDLKGHSTLIKNHIHLHLHKKILHDLPEIKKNSIAVHIRLGDYPEERRTPISWYTAVINTIEEVFDSKFQFLVFTDGKNDEILPLLKLKNVKRVNFGSAIADLWAISQTDLVIGSDSTFSAWGAFLNQVPVIFFKRHFSSVLDDPNKEIIIGNDYTLIKPFLKANFE